MERPNTSAAHSKRTAVVALVVLVLFLLMISPLSGTSGACALHSVCSPLDLVDIWRVFAPKVDHKCDLSRRRLGTCW